MSVLCILYVAALVTVIASVMGKCPLWVPVMLVALAGVLGCLPLR